MSNIQQKMILKIITLKTKQHIYIQNLNTMVYGKYVITILAENIKAHKYYSKTMILKFINKFNQLSSEEDKTISGIKILSNLSYFFSYSDYYTFPDILRRIDAIFTIYYKQHQSKKLDREYTLKDIQIYPYDNYHLFLAEMTIQIKRKIPNMTGKERIAYIRGLWFQRNN